MPSYVYFLPDIEIVKLGEEILAVLPSASAEVVSINNRFPLEDKVTVVTASALGSAAVEVLDQVIDNHKPFVQLRIFAHIPRASPYYDSVKHLPPIDLNYETGLNGRLTRHLTKVFGEVRQVRHCEDVEGTIPVIVEDISYVRDELGFAQERFTEISWVDENGRNHPETKILHKYYSPDDALREGKRRRGNIIDDAMMAVGYLLQVTQQATGQEALQLGRNFLKDNKLASDMFVEASDPGILSAIKYEDDPLHDWLDNQVPGATQGYSIRMYIFEQVNFWGTLWDDV